MNVIKNWNTWDVRCLNAFMKVPEMAQIRIGLFDNRYKLYQEELLWENVKKFGIRDLEGRYLDIDLQFKDMVFKVEFACEGDGFTCRILPVNPREEIKFFISGLFRWGSEGSISKSGSQLLFTQGECSYCIDVVGKINKELKVNVSSLGILMDSCEPIYLHCNHSMSKAEMDNFLNFRRQECIETSVNSGGYLEDSAQAVVKGILWNTIYEPLKDRICTPVSRRWCLGNGRGFGSYVLFEWDTFFAGLLSGLQGKELAFNQIYTMLQEQTERGVVPNFGAERGASDDRTEPPVGAYCALKLYYQFKDSEFLNNIFDSLYKWNNWMVENRDGNGDGLLEWGSDRFDEVTLMGHHARDKQAAVYESGLDNSPMYDDVVFNEKTNTMELTDVGFNALYAMETWALSLIASEIGKHDISAKLEQKYIEMKEKINRDLWDEGTGMYFSRYWNGKFNYRISPTNFYPLIAGVATPERAARMINEHLLNEEEFWGEYVIPSISRNDKAHRVNEYWRGRIWGPMNFLVSEGIKRYGFHDVAYDFADKSLKLFLEEWHEENHIHENYNSVTGDGDDSKNSDPMYTWGGLLPYLAVEEMIDAQPWKQGLRFGNLKGTKSNVTNFPAGDDLYSVQMEGNLTVCRNGKTLFKSTVPVMITGFREEDEYMFLEVESVSKGTLYVYPEENIRVEIKYRGKTAEFDGGSSIAVELCQ